MTSSAWSWSHADDPWHTLHLDGEGVADSAITPVWRASELEARGMGAPFRWLAVEVCTRPRAPGVAGFILTPASDPDTPIAFLAPDPSEWGAFAAAQLPPLVDGPVRLDFPCLPDSLPHLPRRIVS